MQGAEGGDRKTAQRKKEQRRRIKWLALTLAFVLHSTIPLPSPYSCPRHCCRSWHYHSRCCYDTVSANDVMMMPLLLWNYHCCPCCPYCWRCCYDTVAPASAVAAMMILSLLLWWYCHCDQRGHVATAATIVLLLQLPLWWYLRCCYDCC